MNIQEHYVPKTSDQLNQIFTQVIISFAKKLEEADWFNNIQLSETPVMDQIEVSSVEESDQALLYEFPSIYSTDSLGRAYLRYTDELNLAAPIGEYGINWAQSLIMGAIALRNAAKSPNSLVNMIEELDILNSERTSILTDNDSSRVIGNLRPFDEGLQSILFAAGFVTAYKVPGYDDPGKLLTDLAENGIFSKLALITPSTITARMGNRGWTYTYPTTENLKVAKHIVDHFINEKDKYRDLSSPASKLLDRRGCPVARILPGNQYSGVDLLAQVLARTIVQINAQS